MKRYIKSNDAVLAHPAIAKSNLTPKMIEQLGGYHKQYKAGDNIFNLLHAYLQGLEDAGVITDEEYDSIFAEVMELDEHETLLQSNNQNSIR